MIILHGPERVLFWCVGLLMCSFFASLTLMATGAMVLGLRDFFKGSGHEPPI